MYKYRLWKRVSRQDNFHLMAETFKKIHNGHEELKTPRVGGIIIWSSVFLTTMILWISANINMGSNPVFDFISRKETWLPLAGMALGGILGLFEDLTEIVGSRNHKLIHGLPAKYLVLI